MNTTEYLTCTIFMFEISFNNNILKAFQNKSIQNTKQNYTILHIAVKMDFAL